MRYYHKAQYNLDFPLSGIRDDGSVIDFTTEQVRAAFAPTDQSTDDEPLQLQVVPVVLGNAVGNSVQYARATIGEGAAFPLTRGWWQSYIQPLDGGPVFEAGLIEVY